MTSQTLFHAKDLNQANSPEEFWEQKPVDTTNRKEGSTGNSTMGHHLIASVHHVVKLEIVIEGTVCKSYTKFQLHQTSRGHHTFELSLDHNAFGDRETHHMLQTQELLGKRILVRFRLKYDTADRGRDFVGLITEVNFDQLQGSRAGILLKGYSPTILLDRAPHIQSFGGNNPISLHAIVNQLVEEGYKQKGKFEYSIRSSTPVVLAYSCQYNETAFNYLTRMAEAYGETFFYDGETLHFGTVAPIEGPISLLYGRDIDHLNISMAVQHVNREFFGYNSLANERLSATGNTDLQLKGTLAKTAYEKSQRVFTAPSLQTAPIKAATNQEVTQVQKGVIGSVGVHVFTLSGTTTMPFLYPGCIVELRVLQPESKEEHYFTKMMITSISHEVDVLGRYKGHFEAVDAETGFIPRMEHQQPQVEQQIATVVNSTDPQDKGRVQVRFEWQEVDENTAFIRVMTPDAGSSTVVDKNRGFLSIPEVGDQVVVSFMNQHPDRPFVLGSLFHGAIGAGGGAKNNIKSWSTKSGHIIEFHDEGGIKIIDKKKNVIQLDGEGSIFLKSAKSIVLETGKSNLILEENGKISLRGVELIQHGETISSVAVEKLTAKSGGASLILDAEENQANLTAKTAKLQGTSVAAVNGGAEAKMISDGMASIEGAIVKLN